MKHWNRFAAVLGLVLNIVSSALAEGEASTTTKLDVGECKLYFAPSSTSTNFEPAWGLYAGTDYASGDILDSYELGVNIFNLRVHNRLDESSEDKRQIFINDIVTFLEFFMWVPEPAGGKFESDDPQTTYIPGPGTLSAMNEKMINARWNHYSSYHRPMIGEVPGVAHPGRGAQTPFYNVSITATDEIRRGAEIFLSFGANYAAEEEGDESALHKDDYDKLDEMIKKMIEFFDKHEGELDDNAKTQIYAFLTRDVMNAAVGALRQKSVGRIFPKKPDQLKEIVAKGGSMKYDQQAVFRDTKWLEKHGFCADNIQVGGSTIPEAGRGAFASRFLKSGTTIAGTPLIAIPDSSVFEMRSLVENEDGEYEVESEDVNDFQMVLNYCLGHPQSSMVFLPAGAGVAFINHSKEPNAKLAWSKHPASRNDWFHLPPRALLADEQAYLGLVMEVIALRDIQLGEEIFLDYGENWAGAWERHKAEWEEMYQGVVWPAKAIELNDMYKSKPLPTEEEDSDPYPEDVVMVAFVMVKESKAAGTLEDPKVWDIPPTGTVYDAANMFEVTIVERHALGDDDAKLFNYTLRWLNSQGDTTHVANVPHDAFLFVDVPHTSDHFTPSAFRHPIGIPDDVFPQGPWRNLGEVSDDFGDEWDEHDDEDIELEEEEE